MLIVWRAMEFMVRQPFGMSMCSAFASARARCTRVIKHGERCHPCDGRVRVLIRARWRLARLVQAKTRLATTLPSSRNQNARGWRAPGAGRSDCGVFSHFAGPVKHFLEGLAV